MAKTTNNPESRPEHAEWTWPLVLGLAAAIGLGSALLVDGWGDAGAWLGLGGPLVVIGWFLRRR